MTTITQLTDDEFADQYRPIANHLNPHAPIDFGDGVGCMFETWGKELDYVRGQDPSHVWTFVCGDDCDHIVNGLHFVNRMGYFITEQPAPDASFVEVTL